MARRSGGKLRARSQGRVFLTRPDGPRRGCRVGYGRPLVLRQLAKPLVKALVMISSQASPDRWMVIVVEGKPGQENAKVLISGISERVAQGYAQGYNQPNENAENPLVRAIICHCQADTQMA